MFEVKALKSICHSVAVSTQIFHCNDFAGFVASSEQAIRVRQIVVRKLLKYRHQVAIGGDLIGESVVASEELPPSLVYDVSLDDQTRRVFCLFK